MAKQINWKLFAQWCVNVWSQQIMLQHQNHHTENANKKLIANVDRLKLPHAPHPMEVLALLSDLKKNFGKLAVDAESLVPAEALFVLYLNDELTVELLPNGDINFSVHPCLLALISNWMIGDIKEKTPIWKEQLYRDLMRASGYHDNPDEEENERHLN